MRPSIHVSHPPRGVRSFLPATVLADGQHHKLEAPPSIVLPGDLVLHWERNEAGRPTHFGLFLGHHQGSLAMIQSRSACEPFYSGRVMNRFRDHTADPASAGLCSAFLSTGVVLGWEQAISAAVFEPQEGRFPSALGPVLAREATAQHRAQAMRKLEHRLQPLRSDPTALTLTELDHQVRAACFTPQTLYGLQHGLLDFASLEGKHDGHGYAIVTSTDCGRAVGLAARHAARLFPLQWQSVLAAAAYPEVIVQPSGPRRELVEVFG